MVIYHPNGIIEYKLMNTAIATTWVRLAGRNIVKLKIFTPETPMVTDLHKHSKYILLW